MPMTARERSAIRIGIVLAIVIAAFVIWGVPALQEQRAEGERTDTCLAYGYDSPECADAHNND